LDIRPADEQVEVEMRLRCVATIGGVATLVALSIATVPLAGQADPSGLKKAGMTKQGSQFRTPWGDPDLQGVWSYATITPLERPLELAGREFFTPEEAAARNRDVEAEAAPPPGDPGTYNALWFDRGKVATNLRTSLIVEPSDGRLPLTPEAKKKLAEQAEHRRVHPADSWLDRTPWDRCITYHGVPPISTGYNNTYQIFQTPGYVAILVENIHDVRIIPLDARPRLREEVRQWNGDSRGRWEGNTLIVETTNYSDKTELRFPSSRNAHAIERFTRVGENMIDYQFTIEDPTMYTRSWKAVRPMPRLKDYQIYEYACHEGNYAMSGILAGARAKEKEAAEKQAAKRAEAR
jgi:hypothetical protein